MKHFAILLALVAPSLGATEDSPQIATQSAYIQLMSKLDGTLIDVDIPGTADLGRVIWELAERSDQDVVSDWISGGISEKTVLSQVSCLDRPEAFMVENHSKFWRFRDVRELVCTAGGTTFSLEVEVTVRAGDGASLWEAASFQSLRRIK